MNLTINTHDAARGKWFSILTTLGVDAKLLNKRHHPCPFCGGKDRFRWLDLDGSGGYICNQCGAGSGFDLLMGVKGTDFRGAARMVNEIVGSCNEVVIVERDKEKEREAMRKTWSGAVNCAPGGTVDKYLSLRGIKTRPLASVVKQHNCLWHAEGEFPVMLSLVYAPDGTPCNIHRTYLTADGRKAPVDKTKMLMKGEIPLGSYIPLMDCGHTLGVAEGIETALRAADIFGIPVWACYSAKSLEAFTPPDMVESLIIFGDNDVDHFQGQLSAYTLANKAYLRRKREGGELTVRVCIPDEDGKDWADY